MSQLMLLSMDWFSRDKLQEPSLDFVMGKSMVSGHDFPLSQSIDFGIQPFGSFLQCQPQMILGKFLPTVTFIYLKII